MDTLRLLPVVKGLIIIYNKYGRLSILKNRHGWSFKVIFMYE